jgi:hyperosmotically inducible protein
MQKLKLTSTLIAMVLSINILSAVAQQQSQQLRNGNTANALMREVHHQLALLPFYSVFDILSYSVNGTTVTLTGKVTQPFLKSNAEKAVKGIEGVTNVNNQIEVLPLSTFDDQTRHAEFRAVYGFSSLQKYAEGAVPPIHIIVENGHVTLVGIVDSQADKNAAGLAAKAVPNVFSVTNNLMVESGK